MTPLNEIRAIAADAYSWLVMVEADKGPQARLRHWLHGLQAEVERILVVPPGTIHSDGGVPKPTSADGGNSPNPAS